MTPRLVVCDLDGTLIRGSSERELLLMLIRERVLSTGGFLSFLLAYLSDPARTVREGRGWNRMYLKGIDTEKVSGAAARLAVLLGGMVRPQVVARLMEYRAAGAKLALLSASLEPLVSEMASVSGFDLFRGSTPEVSNGLFTGRISGIRPWGAAKVAVAGEIISDAGLTPRETVAIGDSYSDRHLFGFCAEAVAVSPGSRLRSLSRERGWKVLE